MMVNATLNFEDKISFRMQWESYWPCKVEVIGSLLRSMTSVARRVGYVFGTRHDFPPGVKTLFPIRKLLATQDL